MSTSPPPPGYDPKQAKADVKAAKARAKALRPFWKKKRVLIPVAILAVLVAGGLAGGGDKKTTTSPGTDAPTTTAATDGVAPAAADGVTGESSEKDDVVAGKCTESFGFVKMPLTVTNNSSKRSSYLVEFRAVDASGVQIGSGIASVNNLDPSAVAKADGAGTISEGSKLSSCTVVNVERFAS